MERMKREIPKHSNSLDRISALENDNKRLEEENKKLKAELQDKQKVIQYYRKEKGKLKEENKKLKETIKDHQLYEEKLEHRIIEFEELLH
jgi:predicted  nucleic acid-binding Zn-ribbon protein